MQPPEDQPPPQYPQPPQYPPAPQTPPSPQYQPPYPDPNAAQQYQAPPAYGMPPSPPPRRRGGLIAIIAIALVVLLVAGGYLIGGFVVAQGKLSSSRTTYNDVMNRQNQLTELMNGVNTKFGAVDVSNPTKQNVQQATTLTQQLVTDSQNALPRISNDDSALAGAQASLKDSEWLTVLSRSSLDQRSVKIGYLRSALQVAKTEMGDLVQYGNFSLALLAAVNDFLSIGDAAQNRDFPGMTSAVTTLKSDVAKGISLDHAPGLLSQVDLFMHDLMSVANDFSALISAAASGNSAAITKAENTLNTDTDKLQGYDFASWSAEAIRFYDNLKTEYNSDIDKANNAP